MIALVILLTLGAGDEQRALCRDAYEQSQELRAQGQLLAARKKLAVCAVGKCPEFIRRDCAVWSTEVANEQPTMLVVARTEAGRDTLVRVWLDEVLISESAGPVPLEVDPGEHRLRFEADGSRPVEQRVVFRVGEKRKNVAVTLPPLEVATPPTLVPRETQPPVALVAPVVTKSNPLRVTGFITAGAAVASAIVGAAFTVSGLERERTLSTSCAPFCSAELVGPLRTEYAIADTTLIIAGALAVAAVVQLMVSFVND